MGLSRYERRQFAKIAQALAQDRDFVSRMAAGRPLQRRFLTALFFAGVVLTLVGVVIGQLTPGGIVIGFHGLLATAAAMLGQRRMITGTS